MGQWHWARKGMPQKHQSRTGKKHKIRVMGSRCKGSVFLPILIERENWAHKSKLVIPSFKTLQRVPSSCPPPLPSMIWFLLLLPYPMVKLRRSHTWKGGGVGSWTSFLSLYNELPQLSSMQQQIYYLLLDTNGNHGESGHSLNGSSA